jgi:hypothetical protein
VRLRVSTFSHAAVGCGVVVAIVAVAGCGSSGSASGSSSSAVFTPAPPGEGDSPQQACIAASTAWSIFSATYVAGASETNAEVVTKAENSFQSISTQLTTYLDYFPEAGHYDPMEALISDTNTMYEDFADLLALETGQTPRYPPVPATPADESSRLAKDYATFRSDCAKAAAP